MCTLSRNLISRFFLVSRALHRPRTGFGWTRASNRSSVAIITKMQSPPLSTFAVWCVVKEKGEWRRQKEKERRERRERERGEERGRGRERGEERERLMDSCLFY